MVLYGQKKVGGNSGRFVSNEQLHEDLEGVLISADHIRALSENFFSQFSCCEESSSSEKWKACLPTET